MNYRKEKIWGGCWKLEENAWGVNFRAIWARSREIEISEVLLGVGGYKFKISKLRGFETTL